MSSKDVIISSDSLSVARGDYTCPICACTIEKSDEHLCETCFTPHHKDCWEYAGGCAIFGCRKGIIRERDGQGKLQEAIAPVNLGTMGIWSWFFRIHWFTFLLTSLGLITSSISVGLGMLITMLLHIFSITYYSLFISPLISLAWVSAAAVPLGAITYLLLLPVAVAMRIHFRSINLTLPPGSGKVARSIADRMDMPDSAFYAKKLSSFLRKFTNILIGITLIAGLLEHFLVVLRVHSCFPLAIGFLLLARLIMLPMLEAALNSRVTFLVTFQNRLIATAKCEKASKSGLKEGNVDNLSKA